jgi:phosphoribosylglycinamide formyltransferase-1
MIGVLTYSVPHHKTQELLFRLAFETAEEVVVCEIPWQERKAHKPLYKHRPSKALSRTQAEIGARLGMDSMPAEEALARGDRFEMFLIGGAQILSADVVDNAPPILNAHPGLIPYARGLDALKWALYHDLPVGVTTHVIDAETDAGAIVEQEEVPLYAMDTFHAFAYRQFDLEIDMLARAPQAYREKGTRSWDPLPEDDPAHQVFKRMPKSREVIMAERFEQRRIRHGA